MRVFMLGALAGFSLALCVSNLDRPADAGERSILGAGEAGALDEKIRYRTEGGSSQTSNFRRSLVKIPKSYGNLVASSGGDGRSILWFQGGDGILRNVILDADGLYHVEHEAQ